MQTTSHFQHVANVIVPIADQDAAIAFYTGPLGMELRVDLPFGGEYRWVEVAPPGATTSIALAPPNPDGSTELGGRQTGITLVTDDIDATHADLRAQGVDVDAEISRMGDPVPPMFWFRDHEANVLLVVAAPPA